MEKLEFKIKKANKNYRYNLIKEISDKVDGNTKKWLGRLRGIETKELEGIYQSAKAMARDKNMSFAISWNWHIKEILKLKK